MKRAIHISFLVMLSLVTYAQESPVQQEQQLEDVIAVADESTIEDDAQWQLLEQFRKHPVNLNTADAGTLRELAGLSDWLITQLLAYRNLLGSFISIYELQAVPGWHPELIRRLLPFITIATAFPLKEEFGRRLKKGIHSILYRTSITYNTVNGKKVKQDDYPGDPTKMYMRYRYAYKDLLQYGITAEKDAGERFFAGAQQQGFDFYSFHVFARKMKNVKALAIGDYSVNIGQGLIHWQGLAFKKSAGVVNIKRQAATLRPYNSAGEFNFHRGAAVSVQKNNISITSFISFRNLSATLVTDSAGNANAFSAFRASGYHRTASETAGRNSLQQQAGGMVLQYARLNWQVGLNAVGYKFALPLEKSPKPYNLYAISGKRWYNWSIDYSYTWKNVHGFGELAIDKKLAVGMIHGLLVSLDRRADLSILFRGIAPSYQSFSSNAFTENSLPGNETGLFAGLSFRLAAPLRLDLYADIYRFPWLKFGVDAPSSGREYLVQLTWTVGKKAELSTRYKNEWKQGNEPGNQDNALNGLVYAIRQSWRTQLNYKVNTAIQLRNRVDLVWYNRRKLQGEAGFLCYSDLVYKPALKPYSVSIRYQYFMTSGYESRLYAYENDVLYGYSIPAFYDEGTRYYVLLNYDLNKRLSCWLRWSQTMSAAPNGLLNTLQHHEIFRASELRVQLVKLF